MTTLFLGHQMFNKPSELRATDVWANYWPDTFFSAYRPLGEVYDKMGIAGQATNIESLLTEAEKTGVEKIIISATDVPNAPCTNKDVADAISNYKDILIGCASLNPSNEVGANVSELHRCVEVDDFRALKVLPFLHGLPPNHARYLPLYETCVDLGIPLLVLTGHQALLVPSDIGRPTYIDDIALRYPELTIVAGPGGWPWTDELIALAWKHSNLFIHTVIAPPAMREQYLPSQLLHYITSLGIGKVMWGTGAPFMNYVAPLEALDAIAIDPDARRAFLWDTAARVWGWD